MKAKKISAWLLTAAILGSMAGSQTILAADTTEETAVEATTEDSAVKTPKYIFLFIGDGMS